MRLLFFAALIPALAMPVRAVDHNNLDSGRPLDFDDAESIAWGEQAIEAGVEVRTPRQGRTALGASAGYLYGFAKNSHLSLDFHPAYSAGPGGGRRFDAGDTGIGVFHNFNREYGRTPAFSLRADAYLPTGRGSNGVDLRLRAIASRRLRGYGRLHLNLDLAHNAAVPPGGRAVQPGLILGYSRPLGYPTSFTRTLVAQAGVRASALKGGRPVTTLGLGLRQQVGVRSVLDIGIKTDVTGGPERAAFSLVAGISRQF